MSDELEDIYGSFEDDVGIDSDEDKKHGQSNRTEWFKGDKGRTYRVALVYFHTVDVAAVSAAVHAAKKKGGEAPDKDAIERIAKEAIVAKAKSLDKSVDKLTDVEKLDINQVKFKKFRAHYKEGVGYVLSRLGLDGADADSVWKAMGDVKNYFSTVVLFYACDKDGNLAKNQAGEIDKAALLNNWSLLPWRFGPKTYDSIWTVNKGLRSNDLTIADQDLILKCENAEYQNFKITAGGKATWRKSPELQKRILEKAIGYYDKLVPFREMSTADLRIKLGMGGGQAGEEVSQDEFNDILDGV